MMGDKRGLMNNKKGQGLSTNAIILIVLGVVVLVILIAGFTIGWSNIAPWLSSENVGTIVSSCETSCSTNNQYAFCSKTRKLVDADKVEVETSCEVLSKLSRFNKYAVAECSSITSCDVGCTDLNINGNPGVLGQSACDVATQDDLSSIAMDADGAENFCCVVK